MMFFSSRNGIILAYFKDGSHALVLVSQPGLLTRSNVLKSDPMASILCYIAPPRGPKIGKSVVLVLWHNYMIT